MRVADWHTYFVGAAEWGFNVWAHNAPCTPAQQVGQSAAGSRRSLRTAMQAAFGWVAHHIIPVSIFINNHPLVLAAVRAGFSVNRAMNGVLLKGYKIGKQHVDGHPKYIRSVENKLDAIMRRNGGPTARAVQEFLKYVSNLQKALPKVKRLP